MAEQAKADISKEQLIEDGWIKTSDDPIFLLEKPLPNRNPLNASEDSDIKLVVHGLYNTWMFAVLLPDGGLLNFVANNMKELNDFEERIDFYDPPF